MSDRFVFTMEFEIDGMSALEKEATLDGTGARVLARGAVQNLNDHIRGCGVLVRSKQVDEVEG